MLFPQAHFYAVNFFHRERNPHALSRGRRDNTDDAISIDEDPIVREGITHTQSLAQQELHQRYTYGPESIFSPRNHPRFRSEYNAVNSISPAQQRGNNSILNRIRRAFRSLF